MARPPLRARVDRGDLVRAIGQVRHEGAHRRGSGGAERAAGRGEPCQGADGRRMGQQEDRRRCLGQARPGLAADGKQPPVAAIGRGPADGEEQQLRHCRRDEHRCETRRRFGTWHKGQHSEAQRHGRREIAQYRNAAGEDQNTLRARHRPIVSFQIIK
jgi:hypothetical protein